MGDHEGWAQPSGLLPNGLLPNEASTGVTRVLDSERWAKAEERTAELIARIQPSRPSEERRNAVANYVRRLIMRCFSCHVFTFGSVPLKTYLPDGDIDLTAFSRIENVKDHWAKKVRDVLKNEEISENAEFHVKEVQYIEAEVQIIKCLVENIVVDISFNQVGGLCTLCFLDEIDHLINNDYLFKRSIILIKAWCYYESRLLGAHHGLISTYALEMLVLYIFNVFNNSFAGPLEVLYRFLEFFSNFDWDNFCVSLWGPVPISSLPDMRAEPPRKDSGRLLFNDFFLASCNKVYAAKPPDNQGQSFVPKHFNVIDPLRTNNNLGRSVSKGNFFRIRSAFAFGAKKLARIFECPKEDLIVEVNQFFMNTWERHGSGNRPDAPISYHVRPSKSLHIEDSSTSRNTSNTKKRGEDLSSQGSIPQVINFINQNNLYGHKTWTPSFSNTWTPSLTQYQRSYANNIVSRDSDQLDRTATNSSGSLQPDKSVKNLKPDYSFARTRSSPELTDTSAEISSRIQPNRTIETGNTQISHARLRKNSSSEVSGHNTRPSFDDPSFLRHSSSHQSLEASTEANSVSNSFHDEACLLTTGEELPSVSEALELEQEEQDLVNMMASRLHTFNGQLPLPMHLTSSHIPLHLSPVLASMSYGQRNLAGMVPGNFTLIDHSWGSGMQFPQGFVSSPLSPYFASGSSLSSNTEELESGNESSSLTELNPEDSSDQGRGFDSDNGGAQVLHLDDKQHPLVGPFNNFVPSTLGSNPGASFIQGQQQKIAEPKAQVLPEAFPYDRNPKSKVLPTSQACSSQSKSSSESSRDGASTKIPKSSRDKWGRKPGMNTGYGGAKSGWQVEGFSGHVSLQDDEDNREWVPLSTVSTEMVDGNPRNHQSPGYEPTQQISGDSMIPIAPMVVGNSRRRADNNSGVVPIAFYPTGPPVPFLTVLPVPLYNFQSDSGNPNGSSSHFDKDGIADSHVSASDQNFEAADNFDQSEPRISSAAEPSDERKSDILHSDFASHWQNLQYARLCQTNHNQGSLIYPSPVTMPPVYLQGNIPWEGPGRPVSGNMNLVAQVMGYGGPQLVPVAPLQSGPNNPTGIFQRYGDEAPRFRGGTGTYLPNPKVPYRDRQFPSSRNHRGNYNYDRSDQSDREGSWITAKARAAGRSHGRSQAEKQSTRSDRLGPTDKRPNRPWDSYRHETVASHRPQNTSFGSSNSSHASPNMPYGMYSVSGVSSNGVGPSVVMLYPYDQGAGYGPSSESLEFGSLGPVQLPSVHEVSHGSDGNLGRRVHEQRHGTYQGNSPRSSPDQPSSPHIQRGL